jgi:hypothetical protein
VLVILVVVACARVWVQLLTGQRKVLLHEEPYVSVSAAEASARA